MKRIVNFWKKLGPGFVTGASDNDPSGITTYTQAGAAFGLSTLWTALITYPLMYCIQEMCARIGIVTGKGLGQVIHEHYPRCVIGIILAVLFPAITFNIAANLAGMGEIAHLLLPFIPVWLFVLSFALLIIVGLIVFSYPKMASILKWLGVSLLVYAIVPFLIQQDWSNIFFAAFIPSFTWSKNFLAILVAILGTTISPYLFLWQTSMSIEDKNHKGKNLLIKEIKDMKLDVNVGMIWSNFIMFFIILTAGTVLFPAGITEIETVQDAAEAIKPLAGNFAYQLFALGVIGTGLLAIPVLAGSLGYLFADVFGWEKGMDKHFKEAKRFYFIILTSIFSGFLMNTLPIDPILSLIYTAIIYGIVAPFLIAIILDICNKPLIMKDFTNSRWSNFFGFLTFFLMGSTAIFLISFLFI